MTLQPEPSGIAPLTDRHYTQVAALHLLGWQQAYAPIYGSEALQHLSLPAFEQLWQERLQLSGRYYLGLWQAGELLGFAGYGPLAQGKAVGEIFHFYFHPHSWGRGVASPFMQQLLATMQEEGYQQLVLWVLEANERARRFYTKWGFAPNGLRQERSRYGLLLEEVQLERTLPAFGQPIPGIPLPKN
jgi:RimJ/RimL family protein N-acetyltransferase